MISKTEEHEINRAGKRLLREVLEPLGWVVNDVQEDYAIDSNVQVFNGKTPTVYWYAPQLDGQLARVLAKTGAKFITVRIPTGQQLPTTAPDLVKSLNTIYLTLASRELTSASTQSFAESITHLSNQETLHRAFQEKADTLKLLQKIRDLFRDGKWDEAHPRAEAILADPDSTVEVRFWAQIQLEAVDYATTLHGGKPQGESPKVVLAHAKALQRLTRSGPKHLKFFSLIARHAADLDILVHENSTLFMALHQHLEQYGNPMMALGLYARKSALTKRIVSKYNQCVRLARYATHYPDRWMLGRALPRIINAIGEYLITLRSERNFVAEKAFSDSAFQICKLAAWICEETGDSEGVVLVILSALMTAHSQESDAYRWATQVAQRLVDPQIRAQAFQRIDRATRRWRGERVEGDYHGDTTWQIIEKMASAFGIDLSDENAPLVRGLRIAAKDNSPERVLARCEHIIVSQGATGPIAREIWRLFNITTASSKVVHCTLHNLHVEGKDLDSAYGEFKRAHCDSCPDQKPRAEGWRYSEGERRAIEARHREFVVRNTGLSGCSNWNPFGKLEKRQNAANSNVFVSSAKLPKLRTWVRFPSPAP